MDVSDINTSYKENMARKRLSAIVLILAICFTLLPGASASAAVKKTAASGSGKQTVKQEPLYSEWAYKELALGDCYGIYPLTWYEKGLTKTITEKQMTVLFQGLRSKLKKAEGVTPASGSAIDIKKNMTVADALGVFYSVIKSNSYSKDIGLGASKDAVAFMKASGIFTGKNGELALKDKCSLEQACVFAIRIVTYIYDKEDAASKGFLWEVKKGGNTVYMLGSIHMADSDIYPFSEKMLDAYRSSDALVLEVNLNDQSGLASYASMVRYTDGTTLKDHVSADCYEKTVKAAAVLGISEEVISQFKPWYLYTLFSTLSANAGNTSDAVRAASYGIDMSFLQDATVNDKNIQEIEGYVKQGQVLNGFSKELQEYLLNNSIDSLNTAMTGTDTDAQTDTFTSDLLNNWLKAWHDGDVDAFMSSYNVEDDVVGDTFEGQTDSKTQALMEEYYNALLTDRNKGMADYIDKLLSADGSKTYFVVVGAMHYLSDGSVLDILKSEGYEISQIK